jgi:acetyl-CoA carboxylase carboxyl transferase beta subunit/acetyl-CoA carboxylase carboxyl transferase alpha subunit
MSDISEQNTTTPQASSAMPDGAAASGTGEKSTSGASAAATATDGGATETGASAASAGQVQTAAPDPTQAAAAEPAQAQTAASAPAQAQVAASDLARAQATAAEPAQVKEAAPASAQAEEPASDETAVQKQAFPAPGTQYVLSYIERALGGGILVAGFGNPAKAAVRACQRSGCKDVWVTGTRDKERAFTFAGAAKVSIIGEKFDKRLFTNEHAVLGAIQESGAKAVLVCDASFAESQLLRMVAQQQGAIVLTALPNDRTQETWVYQAYDPAVLPEHTVVWGACPKCKMVHDKTAVLAEGGVCPSCGELYRLNSDERIEATFDAGTFEEWFADVPETDPLDFPDYDATLERARKRSGMKEAVRCGTARLAYMPVAFGIMESTFMMGSMGTVVGEKLTRMVERATELRLPVIIFTASGGARMQEGLASLMQMAKVSAAIERHSEAGLLYISVITDPTTGGVTASFATEGDIIIAEPHALIGFAGRRVIQDTIHQELPKGFQTAEFALEHGLIDAIVPRDQMRRRLAHILALHQATSGSCRLDGPHASLSSQNAAVGAAGDEGATAPSGTTVPDGAAATDGEATVAATEGATTAAAVGTTAMAGGAATAAATEGATASSGEGAAATASEGTTATGTILCPQSYQDVEDALAGIPLSRSQQTARQRPEQPEPQQSDTSVFGMLRGLMDTFAKPMGAETSMERAVSRHGMADMPRVRPVSESDNTNRAWESVQLARNTHRPTSQHYINSIVQDFFELHGDRMFGDDGAILAGIGWIGNQPVTVIAEEKGADLDQRIKRNFGCPQPEGYRKSLRLMRQAEKFGRPVVCFVDTQGAFCGDVSEERGQGNAIADNLVGQASLRVPIVSVVLGEGGSGGALALAMGNRVAMQEHAVYSVLSPEGFASILWKDRTRAPEAAAVMRMSAQEAHELGIVEEVLPEGPAPSHENPDAAVIPVRDFIERSLAELVPMSPDELVEQRYERFRKF